MEWEAAERVQKNNAGQYRALIEGEWVPVARAQKNAQGQYRVMREGAAEATPTAEQPSMRAVSEIPQRRGFFERFAGVGPSAGIVDPSIPSKLTPAQQEELAREQLSLAAGFVAGPAIGAGLRGVAAAAPATQRVVTPLIPAIESAGIRTGLPTGTSRAQQIALRATGGGVTGGAAGLPLNPEEAALGAGIGAGLAVAFPPLAGVAGRATGWLADLVSRRLPKTEANQLINLTVRGEMEQVRNAMLANPDAIPSRVAADLNYPTLSAMLKKYEAADLDNTASLIRQNELDKFVNDMTALAGGETATAAQTARGARRKELVEETGKLREEAFAKARRTGDVMPLLEIIGSKARADAADAVDLVRRMGPAISRAEEWAKNWSRLAGPRFSEPGDLAALIPQRIEQAAEASLQAGGRARAAENTLQSMRDRGLTPIRGADIQGSLRRLLSDPEIAENAQARAGVEGVIDALGRWTNEVGVVTPEALYAIRKNAVTDAVRKLMPGADEKSVQKFAAGVISNISPKIDDAIVRAGGTEWPQYLAQFGRGMDEIRRMAFFDELRVLAEKGTPASKRKLYNIIAGEDPEFIEEVFGSGRFDVNQMVPEQRQLFEDLLIGLRADIKAGAKAKEGAAALRRAEEKVGGLRVRFPWFSRFSSIGNETVRAIESVLDEKTQDALVYAAQSGRNFADVLAAVPTKERNAVLRIFQRPEEWNNFVGQVAQAAQAQATVEPMNALAPESQNALVP
jgi:hypothetical protein